jgi:hypothetical protein
MSDPELRVTKVKWDLKKVRIEYERIRPEGDPDEFVIGCGDEPSRAFKDALAALRIDLNTICQFDPPLDVTIRGVSFSWTDDIMGACITALKSLTTANSPLVLTTPHVPEKPYGETGGGPTMPAGMAERLERLIDEARRYILGGAREQARLFDPPAAGEGAQS